MREASSAIAIRSIAASLLDVVDRSGQASAEAHAQLAAIAYRLDGPRPALRHAACAALLRPFDSRTFSNFAFYLQVAGRSGYQELFTTLSAWLAEITGFDAVSLQPNAGAQGEYTGMLVILSSVN